MENIKQFEEQDRFNQTPELEPSTDLQEIQEIPHEQDKKNSNSNIGEVGNIPDIDEFIKEQEGEDGFDDKTTLH